MAQIEKSNGSDITDLQTLVLPLTIISSSPQKVQDISVVVGGENVSWVQYEPQEFQASKELDRLRMMGEENYPGVAYASALQKFDLIQKGRPSLSHGDTIVDSTLWLPWCDGLPGLNAAQLFASCEMPDGTVKRSESMLKFTCEEAKANRDKRVFWIETAVTAECQPDGEIFPRVRQRIGLCFVPDDPYVEGAGMWSITCPNPVRLAELRGDSEAVRELSGVEDVKWALPQRAAEMGLLVPFAALPREEAVKSSPRGDLFSSWVRR